MKKMILSAPSVRRKGRWLQVEWVADEKVLLFHEMKWDQRNEPNNRENEYVDITLDEFERLAKFVAELCRA